MSVVSSDGKDRDGRERCSRQEYRPGHRPAHGGSSTWFWYLEEWECGYSGGTQGLRSGRGSAQTLYAGSGT